MTRFGLDSVGEVPVAAHHAVGSSVALRYLSRSTSKVITRAEHDRYKAGGIDLVLVFEDYGRPDRSGYDGGKADAQFALNQAHSILGTPPRPARIRFAADYDPAGHPEQTDPYFDGVAAVMGRVNSGPYGSDAMVAHHARRGFQTLWQTYAWSGGRFFSSPYNTVYQYANGHAVAGVGVDFNHLFGPDFGQWDYRPAPPADDHHYERFPADAFAWKGRLLRERATVVEYDKLRQHPFVHRPRLAVLRSELKDLADRVYFVAHEGKDLGAFHLPPAWHPYWRGWRWQQLWHRYQGQRIS